MDKALADIPVGNQISSSPPREHWSPLTTNNFAQMTGRSSKGWKGYDYSHILKPEHQEAGYSLSVYHDTDEPYKGNYVMGVLKHKGKTIGTVHSEVKSGEEGDGNLEFATNRSSYVNPLHKGKGLGVSMYEGVMAHAKNVLGAKDIVGGIHSTSASNVHSAISKKHGLDYEPDPTIYNHFGEKRANRLKEMGIELPDKQKALENFQKRPIGPNDGRFASYQYTLKSEELNKVLSDIPTGRKVSEKEHDYSHVLSPEHTKQGYSLSVLNDNGKIFSTVKHNGKAVGNVYGSTHKPNTLDLSSGFASHLADEHQNKGLGTAMYEALFAHAHNNMGVNKVIGGKHSTSASKVHSKIAVKHGLDYTPQLNPEATMSDEEYNSKVPRGLSAFSSNVKYGPYSYTLKSENILQFIKNISDLVKTIKTISPDESTTSEPGYSYHITSSDNLHSIAETGLGTFKPWHGSEQDSWPDGATEKRNYFHSNIKGTLPFGGPNNAILRVNQQLHPVKQEAYTKDLYSRKTVHPDNIELLTEHGWHPIKKWSEDKIKPQIQLKFPFAKSLNKSEHTWRNKPILKDKDAQGLDQTTTAYALKLGDTKKAEEKAYNEYQRNHRLDAAAHHYKALGMALAKCNQNAAAHHRLAYQGHMQALGLNGLESPPRAIMERIRQMVDNEQFRFKAHPADIF